MTHVACMGNEKSCRIIVKKYEWKRPVWKTRHGWADNIEVDIKGTGCGLEPSGSAYDPVVHFCEHIGELSGSIKGR